VFKLLSIVHLCIKQEPLYSVYYVHMYTKVRTYVVSYCVMYIGKSSINADQYDRIILMKQINIVSSTAGFIHI